MGNSAGIWQRLRTMPFALTADERNDRLRAAEGEMVLVSIHFTRGEFPSSASVRQGRLRSRSRSPGPTRGQAVAVLQVVPTANSRGADPRFHWEFRVPVGEITMRQIPDADLWR